MKAHKAVIAAAALGMRMFRITKTDKALHLMHVITEGHPALRGHRGQETLLVREVPVRRTPTHTRASTDLAQRHGRRNLHDQAALLLDVGASTRL